MSVGSVIASPLAKRLFPPAILEGGTGVFLGLTPRETAQSAALQLAESLHVRGTGAEAARRLRALSPDTILKAFVHRPPNAPQFAPVIDGWALPHAVDSTRRSGAAI